VQYYKAGPERRAGDGGIESADPANNRNNQPRIPTTAIPSTTMIRLEKVPRNYPSVIGLEMLFDVKIHYRILKPGYLTVLLNPQRTLVIDPSYAAHADPTEGINFSGDTTVSIRARAQMRVVMTSIIHSIAHASGLGHGLISHGDRLRWVWACFAECAMLSERLDKDNNTWPWIGPSMESGGWWFTVYLVEALPAVAGGWISNGV
jgi:hypothetical protein